MRLSLRPSSIPPSADEILSVASDLRAELEGAVSPEERALLLYEIGVLEELHRDDHGAAKDLLAAVNAGTTLSEPLERLIALIERRHSYQNLGKLLDRLGRVAATPEEVVRAQVARGDFLADQRKDDEGARGAYAIAEQAGVELTTVWLSLELLAGKQQDQELLKRVTAARAAATQDPGYRALLRLRGARAALRAGDERAAVRQLEQLAAEPSAARADALHELEKLAEQSGESQRSAELQEARAGWLAQLAEHPSAAHTPGLTAQQSLLAAATELWVRVARKWLQLGDHDRALANLARAERVMGNNPLVLNGLLDAHAALGNPVGAAHAVAALLELSPQRGSGQAALLWRSAELEHRAGNTAAALITLRRALESDGKCMPARALQLHLLLAGDDAAALADALETVASESRNDGSRARYYALAALCWAQSSGNSDAARAALSQASLAGVPTKTAARWAKLLAELSKDARWQLEASERLLKSGTTEEEASTRLHQVRSHWLREQAPRTQEALAKLAEHPSGGWIAALLLAYPAFWKSSAASSDLEALTQLSTSSEPPVRAALRQITALRLERSGNGTAAAALLSELHKELPGDLSVAAALAANLQRQGDPQTAAVVLSGAAELTRLPDVALALQLKAGILAWHGGDRQAAVDYFERASATGAAGNGLLHWALRSAQPDDLEARARALQVALETTGDADVYALESFALHVANPATHTQATRSLDRADEVSLGESGEAIHLARSLWPSSTLHKTALRHIEGQSSHGQEIALAVRFLQARALPQVEPAELHKLARAWATSGSLLANLEWLASSLSTLDVSDELLARGAITRALAEDAESSLAAGTALVRLLSEAQLPALLVDPHPQARLANLELAPPGCDPRRRALALSGTADTLGDDNEALSLALAGYNELLAQNNEAALASFRAVISNFPEDLFGWEGLRMAAAALEDRRLEADACLKLGEFSRDNKVQARFFRDAAALLLDDLQDEPAGHAALERAVELDIRHKAAFNRYYALLKSRKDPRRISELLERRIAVSNEASELVTLYWDRARAYREMDELERALEELTNLSLLDPGHVGSRALRGEIFLRQSKHEDAARELSELATLDGAPDEQRLMGGIAAVDLFESQLNDLSRALDVLRALQAARLDTLAVQERLARATAKAERWQDAAELLEQLVLQRQTSTGRSDAARLLLAVYRDKLQRPERARAACETILREAPTDPETIDFILEDVLDEAATLSLLMQIKSALLSAPLSDLSAEQLARIARVSEALEDLPLRQAALGALVSVGVTNAELRDELSQLDARCEPHPQVVIAHLEQSGLLHPADQGPLSQAFQLLGPYLSDALGPSLASLDVGRRQRLKAPMGASLRTELAAFAGAFGVGDFEIYVGGPDPLGLAVVGDPKTPSFVVGSGIKTPLSPAQRARVAQLVLGLVRGTYPLIGRDWVDAAALACAACKWVDAVVPGPSFAMTAEFERALSKHLPRKIKRDLASLLQDRVLPENEALQWAQAVHASLDRCAALAVGDASWVVVSEAERQLTDRQWDTAGERRVWPLLRFVLSSPFLDLRAQLGMSAR